MKLKQYLSKRNLAASKEPATGASSEEGLHFCIQKHDARRLHYDVRLEYRGVLLSWAVPKGPSLDPKDKRLAIKVEDHPLDYQYFEGVIPKGNYGAGTVEIWDKGTYTAPHADSRISIEKYLKEGLQKGHFAVILQGDRLNGEYVFQKLKKEDSEDHAWLLIKKPESNPDFIAPMLAELVDKPFDSKDWLFELKWDGYRSLAFVNRPRVLLKSRNNLSWEDKFPSIVEELKKINHQVILDGELVVLDETGKPNFQLMQNYQKTLKGNIIYYVFDLLFKDGEDLRELPLIERKTALKNLLEKTPLAQVRYSDHVIKEGKSLFKEAKKANLEGIMGKKITSAYQSKRSHDWVKIKTSMRQEVIIGGFTEPRGSRKKFGALLIGIYNDKNELIPVGHVGGGFNTSLLQEVYDQLKPWIQKECPFKKRPKANMPVTWVKPMLIGEVSFTEWTEGNQMRHPIFQGLRMDKPPKSIKKEEAISNPEKIYWPKENYTKKDLIDYYTTVSSYLLPYLKDRPIMLHRYPNGIEGPSFYQKDLASHPEWIKTYPINHEHKVDHYLVINDLDSLLYAINLGSIELHPFLSRSHQLETPDYCVIDLDPHGVTFNDLIETAAITHQILDQIGVRHYCKTSGKKGLHILIPLKNEYTYGESQNFATLICSFVHQRLPAITSLERNPKKRENKIYLDCLQNRIGQTIVAPYSVRPEPGAPVSTPLHWDEVNKKLKISQFTIKTIPKRLKDIEDPFKPILKPGINMKTALTKLKKLIDT